MTCCNSFRQRLRMVLRTKLLKSTDGDLLRGETGSYVKNTTYTQTLIRRKIGEKNFLPIFFTLWASVA